MPDLKVNRKTHHVEADPKTPLLWVLREQLGLTGTKFGCGIARCGACTVHVAGQAVRSCSLPLAAVGDREVTTIEGLSAASAGAAGAAAGALHPLQRAWIAEQVPQCGYCQSGMLMSAAALLRERPLPTDEEIDLAITNLCRCGTYARVRRAIKRASGQPVSGA